MAKDRRTEIDFPCSPIWARWYAEQGLTTDYPPEYYYPDISGLEQKIRHLEALVDSLLLSPVSPTKQEVYENRHLLRKLIERVNEVTKRREGSF